MSSSSISDIFRYSNDYYDEEQEEFSNDDDMFDVNSDCLPLSTIKEEVTGSLFSFDFQNWGDIVYVGLIGKNIHEETSFDALRWTLSHFVDQTNSNALVFLIHIFPEIKQIPTLLGMMPIDQANPKQRNMHLAYERSKRKEFLQKYIDLCSASKVKVDTFAIESNNEVKAILDIIPILNIKKLVLGTSKRNIRSARLGGTASQVIKGAPEDCEVKVICEGKEMVDLMVDSFSSRPSSSQSSTTSPNSILEQDLGEVKNKSSLSCTSCFKPNVME